MVQPTAGQHPSGDSGHETPSGHRRLREQVAALAAQAPGHRLTIETLPGRGERFVARATAPTARPWLVVTDDLDELCTELAIPAATSRDPW
jgi:hypothetical protein